MKTKSITEIQMQANRIREGYGYKQRGKRWNYERYTSVSTKAEGIAAQYVRAIGRYQREFEGMTRETQAKNYLSIIQKQYTRAIYAGY